MQFCEMKLICHWFRFISNLPLPSSVIKILLSTRPPRPQRVSANNDISVTDDINNKSLASNLEPAIRTILSHLN